jgi:methyl-accepting chemotaxis protein
MAAGEVEGKSPHSAENKFLPLVKDGLFKRLKLRTKLNLAMVGIFLIAIVSIYFLASERMEKAAMKQVFAKSRLLLTTMESSRRFTSKVIKPSLYNAIPFKYIVEGMSSASGQQSIFDEFRTLYPKYYFNLAVPNPRNPVNEPNDFQNNIIYEFRQNKDLKQWSGYTSIDGKNHFVVMEPIVANESCLRCHSTPDVAPAELNSRYATSYGFGLERAGDIYGALAVSVPATVVTSEAKNNTLIFIGLVTVFFIVLTLILNWLYGRVVIKPINHLAKNANAISVGNLDTSIDTSGKDEISQLAKSFERMRTSVKLAFDRLKKQRAFNAT